MRNEDVSRAIWNRVDNLWCGKPLKELAKKSAVDYVLFLNWRTKHRLPDVLSACNIARNLNTTVEFLVSGTTEKSQNPDFFDIFNELEKASVQDLDLVRRILRIEEKLSAKRKDA